MESLESWELKKQKLEREQLELRLELLQAKDAEDAARMNKLLERVESLLSIARNTGKIMNDLDAEFESQTGLTGKDFSFLLLATTLQCLRQYFVTDFKERLGDKEAAEKTW